MRCKVCTKKVTRSDMEFRNGACNDCNLFFLRYSEGYTQIQPCISYSYQCFNIMTIDIRACQFCRLYKCIEVGMFREGVRFDRVKALVMDTCKNISSAARNSVPIMVNLITDAYVSAFELTKRTISTMCRRPDNSFHDKSSDFVCLLNISSDFLPSEDKGEKRYASIHENVAEFAGGIPGFSLLSPDDQRALLAPGYFQLLVVRLLPLFGQIPLRCRRDRLPVGNEGELLDLLFRTADEIKEHLLLETEMGIFSSYILMNPDRPGLKDKYTVSFIRNRLKNFLCYDISKKFDINHLTRISDYLDKIYKTHETLSDLSKRLVVISKPSPHTQDCHIPVTSTVETVHSWTEASTSRVQGKIVTEERVDSFSKVKNNPIPGSSSITEEKVKNVTDCKNVSLPMGILTTEERVISLTDARNYPIPKSFWTTYEKGENLREIRKILTTEGVNSLMESRNYHIPMGDLTNEGVNSSMDARNYHRTKELLDYRRKGGKPKRSQEHTK